MNVLGQRTVNASDLTRELVEASTAGCGRALGAERAAAAIRRFGDYRWVGIYDVGRDEIAALAWVGPGRPAHPRFARSVGLCGAAIAARRPVNVGDVSVD